MKNLITKGIMPVIILSQTVFSHNTDSIYTCDICHEIISENSVKEPPGISYEIKAGDRHIKCCCQKCITELINQEK